MLDAQRLRDAKAELVILAEQAELGEIEAVSPGLELTRSKVGPAAAGGHACAPAVAEIAARLDVEEGRRRSAAAQRRTHASAEQALLFVQPADSRRQPVAAEATIDRKAGPAIGRAGRAGLHFLPHVPALAGDGDAGLAELVAHRDAAVAAGREARLAAHVLGDEECGRVGAAEAPLHRLGALGEAERDCCFLVDSSNRRPCDEPRLPRIVGPDAHAVDREAEWPVAILADGHRDAQRSGGSTRRLEPGLERARQRMVLVGLAEP